MTGKAEGIFKEAFLHQAKHKRDYKANRFARDFGRYLQPRLFEGINPLPSRQEAEGEEAALALRLQKRGYAVWWG